MAQQDLYRRNGSAPAPLPSIAYDANGDAWTDLANNEEGQAACGFVLAAEKPYFDPSTQSVRWDAEAEAWAVEDLPPPPPAPEPVPQRLGKGEFYDLVRGVGVTYGKIKQAAADPALEEFWFALDKFYSTVERDHPATQAGIAGMVALGYITQTQSDAIFAAWPTA